MQKLKWGIIGLGGIAHKFAKDLALVKGNQLYAVASRSMEKAKSFAEKYQAEKAYGNYEDLFKDDGLDIVYIATPHNMHKNLSILALQAGKHVLCEKPLAINRKQVEAIITTAQKEKLFVMEAFWSKFNPSIQAVLKLIQSGAIGEVNYVNADFCFLREEDPSHRLFNMELAGGALLDVGVYPIFLAYSILGLPNTIAAVSNFASTGADMQTAITFKYPKAMANLMCGVRSHSDMVAKIYGTKGSIFIDARWHEAQGFKIIRDGEVEIKSYPTNGKGFTYEIEECLKCIRSNQLESEQWSHQNSLDLVSLTDQIREQVGLRYPFE